MSVARPADLLVLAAAAVLVGMSWAVFWTSGGRGEAVRISAMGHDPVVYDLDTARTVRVEGLIGESVIEIRDGRARFTDSPCVGRYCIYTGWLSASGDVAACLPNGVVVEITGGDREYDAVSF